MFRHIFALGLLAMAPAGLSAQSFTLTGWAEIPSTYRHPGPRSGQFITAANGVTPPFDGQPIPGFSGVIPGKLPLSLIGLPDNGYGAQTNSADYVLGFYNLSPAFKVAGNGSVVRGPVTIRNFVPFSDPRGFATSGFINGGPVYNRIDYYPPPAERIPVDPAIRDGKLLTGADFDVESIVLLDDGTFWVGEEFGPYLLHFDAQGRLMSPPVRHPVLRAPQNPQNTEQNPSNLPSSRGFESMARNREGTYLYVTTEASIVSEPDKRLIEIYEFDTRLERYTGKTWKYAKDSSDAISGGRNNATNIFVTGDMCNLGGTRYILIERDDFQGPPTGANPPRQKKLYLFDLEEVDIPTGILKKRLLVDLLDIDDPLDIGGTLVGLAENKFNFPGQSVEAVTPLDDFTLLIGLDTNYPFASSRFLGQPDGTEMITLRSNVPLRTLRVTAPPAPPRP